MKAAPLPETPAVAPLLDRYLTVLTAERGLSPYTVRNYAGDLGHLFAWIEEHEHDPLALTRAQFRAYLASMIEAGTARGSIARRVSTARSFYKWLRMQNVIAHDPLANVGTPRQPRRLPRALTLGDITSIIAAADGVAPSGLRDRALLELMYACGLRVSEAAGLDLAQVDVEQRTLLVHGKGNKERLVVMGEPAADALERYLHHGRAGLLAGNAKGARAASDALFINRFGGRMSQRRVQIIVRKYALKAGIDARVHPHLFRHTFATHLLDGGAELRVVQELMGHSSPNTTQIYLHVTEERQRRQVESSLDGIAEVEAARRGARASRRR